MRIRSQAFVYTFFLTTGILLLYIYSYIVSMPFISVMICARASEVRKNDMVDRHVTENHVTTLTQFFSRSTIDSTTLTPQVSTTTKAHERVDETASKPKSNIEKGIVNQEISDSKECTGFSLKNISDASIIQFYKTCTKKSWQNTKRFGPEMFKSIFTTENFKGAVCKEKSKQYIAGKPLIAMPSFPGSGNTWVRLLLEQMTGIYTGSVYGDSMAYTILLGSRVCPINKIMIVKTHAVHDTLRKKACRRTFRHAFQKAIYIVRNPYNAIIAEFNRIFAGKTATVTQEKFLTKAWDTTVRYQSTRYKSLLKYWLKTFQYPVHVLVYEDLQKNMLWELYKISKFIDFPVTFQTLWCIKARANADRVFLRKKPTWLKAANLYTDNMKLRLNTYLRDLISSLGKEHNLVDTLQSYIL